jgi:hypothetical protein
MDFDVGDYLQAYLAFRADHNEDFDTIAGPTTWLAATKSIRHPNSLYFIDGVVTEHGLGAATGVALFPQARWESSFSSELAVVHARGLGHRCNLKVMGSKWRWRSSGS